MKLRVQVLISVCVMILLGLFDESRTVETVPSTVPAPEARRVANPFRGPTIKAPYQPSGPELTRLNDHLTQVRVDDAIALFNKSGRPMIEVTCTPFQIEGAPASGIRLKASFKIRGVTLTKPDAVTLTVIAENRPSQLGETLKISSSDKGLIMSYPLKAVGTDTRFASVNIGFNVIEEMTTSRAVDIQIGRYKAQLIDSEIDRLRAIKAMVDSGLSF
jgi:hypothetical protein